jgi:hypothetical protein
MKDYDAEISALQEKKGVLLVNMETLAVTFRNAAVPFLASFYEGQAKEIVTRKTEITTSLGKERIATLKQAVNDLQQNAQAIVNEVLASDDLWFHKSNPDNMSHEPSYYFGHRPPEILDKGVRLAAGRLAPILEECGYLPTSNSDHGVWREWDRSGNHHPHNARPCYPTFLDWPASMKDAIVPYAELVKECRNISQRVALLQREKQQKQAEDLWDSA